MTSVLGRLADWLPNGVRTAAIRAGASFVIGTTDERVLNRIATAAVFRTAQQLLPKGAPEEINALAAVIDEVFTPHTLLVPDSEDRVSSIAAAFRAGLIRQLQPLYEPLDNTGFSTAADFNLPVSVDTLADHLMSELCVLIAFDAPHDAATLHALRQAHSEMQGSKDQSPPTECYVRYLVCRSFDIIRDVVAERFERLPVASPVVFPNEVLGFWQLLVARHGGRKRGDEVRGRRFPTSVDYRQTYPDSRRPNPDEHLPAYDLVRGCTEQEIRERVAPSDPISMMLLESGVEASEACLVVGHHELCGTRGHETFLEEYLVRPVWGLLAELRISGGAPWALQSWDGYAQDAGLQKLSGVIGASDAPRFSGRLPQAPIEPAQSVVIPLATLVPRFPLPPAHYEFLSSQQGEDGMHQELMIEIFHPRELDLDVWGPARIPDQLRVAVSGASRTFPLRQFEPTLLYTVNRVWYEGSCPHVFELYGETELQYRGTAFAKGPATEQVFRLDINHGATHLMVAELESEATFIRQALVNDRLCAEAVWVTRGNPLVISVQPTDRVVEMHGYYIVPSGQATRSSSVQRNAVVRDFMRRLVTTRTV